MKEVTLTATGRLLQNVWQRPTDQADGRYVPVDVTDRAEQFLFDPVELAPDATLRSVFLLVMACPGLQSVFHRHRARDICVEGLAEQAPSLDGIQPDDVEYVCVYRTLERNSTKRTLSGFGAEFHGVGPVLTEDVVEGSHVVHMKGTRIAYSFSLTSPQRISHLPLKLDNDLPVYEGDSNISRFWEKTERLTCEDFTLGDVLDSIFWELTFYGVGEDRELAAEELRVLAASTR